MDLTCKEAAELLGLPEAQLLRWAAQRQAGFETGPQFNGSWMQPRYTMRDLIDWRAANLPSSFNGRTPDFESEDRGSSPRGGATSVS